MRARPDGTTLLFNASIHVVVPLINRNVTFGVVNDFSHISLVADGSLLVSTHASLPARTLGEFFARAKQEPERYPFATTGLGSAGHLCVELLKMRAGVSREVVAYRGGGPALAELAAGNLHLLADPMLSSLPLVKAERIKALAVTTKDRTPLAPEVPTVAESGMEPLEMGPGTASGGRRTWTGRTCATWRGASAASPPRPGSVNGWSNWASCRAPPVRRGCAPSWRRSRSTSRSRRPPRSVSSSPPPGYTAPLARSAATSPGT
jgi:tripartite tricarboxylate transporter family receptor